MSNVKAWVKKHMYLKMLSIKSLEVEGEYSVAGFGGRQGYGSYLVTCRGTVEAVHVRIVPALKEMSVLTSQESHVNLVQSYSAADVALSELVSAITKDGGA